MFLTLECTVHNVLVNFFDRHGPLVRQWCMRFEAKHHYFKKLAHGMTNFKNLSKTLAVRHQRLQCYWLSEDDAYLKPVTDAGPGKHWNFSMSLAQCQTHTISFWS